MTDPITVIGKPTPSDCEYWNLDAQYRQRLDVVIKGDQHAVEEVVEVIKRVYRASFEKLTFAHHNAEQGSFASGRIVICRHYLKGLDPIVPAEHAYVNGEAVK